ARIAHRRTGLVVVPDQRRVLPMRKKDRNAADRPLHPLHVRQRNVAFRRRVELEDLRNAEAALEEIPYVAAQAIAACETQTMIVFARVRRAVDQVAAQLADVLEHRAVPLDDLFPEPARGELASDHHRAAADEDAARRE